VNNILETIFEQLPEKKEFHFFSRSAHTTNHSSFIFIIVLFEEAFKYGDGAKFLDLLRQTLTLFV
jgi:hypothetical protein